jgi:hypothetical protein
MTAREWSLSFDPPAEFIVQNKHGREDRRSWSSERAAWRARAWSAARAAKLPTGLRRARIDIVIAPPHEKHDESAFAPTAKIIVDGLGPPLFRPPSRKQPKGISAPGYGLIDNDSRKYLDGEHVHLIDAKPPHGHVTVYVTDLTDVPAGRTWTPEMRTATGRRITVKRCCNGCGERIGDVLNEEIEAAIAGLPLSDVRSECPNCKEVLS